MVDCPSCNESLDTERGMKIHHARIHGVTLARGVRIRAGRKHENRVINLTSGRIYEFLDCRDRLAAQLGVMPETLTAQKVASAAMQTFVAHMDAGGSLTFSWNDNRSAEC